MNMDDRDRQIQRLEERIAVLEQVCAEAYQLAGAVGAPERALDNLAAASEGGPIPHATFLPITAADCDETAPTVATGSASGRTSPSSIRA